MFNVDPNLIIECSSAGGCGAIRAVVLSVLVFLTLFTGFAYTTVLERRFIAFLQARIGPNRAGPLGLLQPLADGIKLIFKEDVTPAGADRVVFWLAPVMKCVPAVMIVAVIPLGPPLLIPWFDGLWYRVPLGLADLNVGVLFILAFMSLGTYGIVLAGWSSANKYAMLGSLRASAQMVSYELSMGLTMAVPILITGSLSLATIIDNQAAPVVLGWHVFQNPISAAVLMIAMLAEVNRAPFDLPEAESELTAGYHTEYSGMKFALLFAMSEYISMISVSMVIIALFFGGYHFILVDQVPLLGPLVYAGKVILFLMGMVWVRATLPRIRYDRLMTFGWKVMLPLALLGVSWTAIALIIGDTFQSPALYVVISTVFFAIVAAGVLLALRPSPESKLQGDQVVFQRRGLGYVLLNLLGAILSIPIMIFTGTQRQVRNVQAILRDQDPKKVN